MNEITKYIYRASNTIDILLGTVNVLKNKINNLKNCKSKQMPLPKESK